MGYESEARKEAEERGQATRTTPEFGPRATRDQMSLTELVRVLIGADSRTSGRPHLALVPAHGAINLRSQGPLGGDGIRAVALTKTLQRLSKDASVKAVVVRIDSPGGSALASDLLWHELAELGKVKPVIASVGGMAASGGYYLASATARIVAERTSIVGSIGVVGGKLVVGDALAEVGVNAVTFAASAEPGAVSRAAYDSPLVSWDEQTRQRIQRVMESVYELFLRRVAEGRRRKVDEIRKVAEGRIYSGKQGRKLGLVDELGGLGRALQLGRELGGLDPDAPISVEGAAEGLLEMLGLGEDADAGQIARALELRHRYALPSGLAHMAERARPFVAAMQPLCADEHVAAALPFALLVD
ncbi:signal peptide peptidase SppA [Myxococcota bacterium]